MNVSSTAIPYWVYFLRLVFCFATGNSDMHLRNFSLIETEPGSQRYRLSEVYDLLPVNIIVPEDSEQMALALNGKKRNLHRNDFLKFAAGCGINRDAAEKMIGKIISMRGSYQIQCAESAIPIRMKERFSALIDERIDALIKSGTWENIPSALRLPTSDRSGAVPQYGQTL